MAARTRRFLATLGLAVTLWAALPTGATATLDRRGDAGSRQGFGPDDEDLREALSLGVRVREPLACASDHGLNVGRLSAIGT